MGCNKNICMIFSVTQGREVMSVEGDDQKLLLLGSLWNLTMRAGQFTP